jgi:C4-dicarboxylate-specific signal transduction histidine kinase
MLATIQNFIHAFRDSGTIPFLLKRIKILPRPILEVIMLAELGKLYAGVLHDLSTPLTALMIHLGSMPAKQHDVIIDDVLISIKKLVQLARNTQYQTAYSSVLISELIQNTQGLLAHRAMYADVRIVSYIEQNVCIYGKKLVLQQILNNLVSNAIDAYEQCDTPQKTVTITATQTTAHIIITVHDTGCGISPVHMKKIFTPGYTTKSSGHGFGLTLTYQLVRFECHGDITVQSNPETGTSCTIQLPKNSRRSEYLQKKRSRQTH